jgi:hypothetical protein
MLLQPVYGVCTHAKPAIVECIFLYLALLLLLLLLRQSLDAELAGHEGDSSDGDGQAPNLLPLIKEIWSR